MFQLDVQQLLTKLLVMLLLYTQKRHSVLRDDEDTIMLAQVVSLVFGQPQPIPYLLPVAEEANWKVEAVGQ